MSIALLPSENSMPNNRISECKQPSYTYAVNFSIGRVRGFTDKIEAMKQAIFKALQTHRFGFDIYNDDYGFEAAGLIGKDYEFIECEIKRRISDALLVDQRIKTVERFCMEQGEATDTMQVSFRVQTIFGDIDEQMEVLLR